MLTSLKGYSVINAHSIDADDRTANRVTRVCSDHYHAGIPKPVSMAVDITERRRPEIVLRASETRLRLVTENMSDLVCLHHSD